MAMTQGSDHPPVEQPAPRRARRWLGRAGLRPLLLALVAGAIILQIVVFSPAPLEVVKDQEKEIDPSTLIAGTGEETLAVGVPKDRIPEYTVEQFEFVSTRDGEKQWKLHAERAFLFSKEKLVHSRKVKAFLYDPEEKITVVTGRESKYYMNQRDLEVFGEVHVVFPDGFQLFTEYLRYLPGRKHIEIPVQYAVRGEGAVQDTQDQNIRFQSRGLEWSMSGSQIVLPQAVDFVFVNKKSKDGPTKIVSDRCEIERGNQLAHFTMSPSRAVADRFVHISQETMKAKARKADLNYGDSSTKMLQYMTLYEDVLIRETGKKTNLQYATGGRADFDSNRNVIVLSEFPQVYQDNDTVTGDIIVLHRDTDVVEVKNSNAFSQGNQ